MGHGPDGIELAVYDQIAEILGVEVQHHDDGSAQGMFDAVLQYPDGHTASLEVTSNPSNEAMKQYVDNLRKGKLNMVGSSDSPGVGYFDVWLKGVTVDAAVYSNFEKLNRDGHVEQHLVLSVRGAESEALMYDMSVHALPIGDPDVPESLTDLWIKLPPLNYLRWNRSNGWSRESYTHPTAERIAEYKRRGGAPGAGARR